MRVGFYNKTKYMVASTKLYSPRFTHPNVGHVSRLLSGRDQRCISFVDLLVRYAGKKYSTGERHFLAMFLFIHESAPILSAFRCVHNVCAWFVSVFCVCLLVCL